MSTSYDVFGLEICERDGAPELELCVLFGESVGGVRGSKYDDEYLSADNQTASGGGDALVNLLSFHSFQKLAETPPNLFPFGFSHDRLCEICQQGFSCDAVLRCT